MGIEWRRTTYWFEATIAEICSLCEIFNAVGRADIHKLTFISRFLSSCSIRLQTYENPTSLKDGLDRRCCSGEYAKWRQGERSEIWSLSTWGRMFPWPRFSVLGRHRVALGGRQVGNDDSPGRLSYAELRKTYERTGTAPATSLIVGGVGVQIVAPRKSSLCWACRRAQRVEPSRGQVDWCSRGRGELVVAGVEYTELG